MDHLSRQFSCTSIADFEELDRAAKARKAEKAAEKILAFDSAKDN